MLNNLFRVADEGPQDKKPAAGASWLLNPVAALFEAATTGTAKPSFHVRVNRDEFFALVHNVQGKVAPATRGEATGLHNPDPVVARALAETMFLDGVGTTKPGHVPGLSVILNHSIRLGV